MKYLKSPFHATHDKETADKMMEAVDKEIVSTVNDIKQWNPPEGMRLALVESTEIDPSSSCQGCLFYNPNKLTTCLGEGLDKIEELGFKNGCLVEDRSGLFTKIFKLEPIS